MRINLAAYTPHSNPYPPYASANFVDDHIELTVRSPADAAGCGTTSCISFTPEAFDAFLNEAREHFRRGTDTFMYRGEPLQKQIYEALDRARENGCDYSRPGWVARHLLDARGIEGEEHDVSSDLDIASDMQDCSDEFDGLAPAVMAEHIHNWRTGT